MKRVIIDRFEGDIAVCEQADLTSIYIKKDDLPETAKPGSILKIYENGPITLDEEEEAKQRKRIKDIYKRILKRKTEKK